MLKECVSNKACRGGESVCSPFFFTSSTAQRYHKLPFDSGRTKTARIFSGLFGINTKPKSRMAKAIGRIRTKCL